MIQTKQANEGQQEEVREIKMTDAAAIALNPGSISRTYDGAAWLMTRAPVRKFMPDIAPRQTIDDKLTSYLRSKSIDAQDIMVLGTNMCAVNSGGVWDVYFPRGEYSIQSTESTVCDSKQIFPPELINPRLGVLPGVGYHTHSPFSAQKALDMARKVLKPLGNNRFYEAPETFRGYEQPR